MGGGFLLILIGIAGLWVAGLLGDWLPRPAIPILDWILHSEPTRPVVVRDPDRDDDPSEPPTVVVMVEEDTPAPPPSPTTLAVPTETPVPMPAPTWTPSPTFTPVPSDTATPTPSPPPSPTPTTIHPRVQIPAGEFAMGLTSAQAEVVLRICRTESRQCATSIFADEQPVHTVSLDAYEIDLYEVTNAQFAQFVEETGYVTDAEREGNGRVDVSAEWEVVDGVNWRHPHGSETDITDQMDHPVVQVTWNDAVAYCAWAGGRLPTDAEWEKAARGTDGRIYPWGNDFDCARANLDDETEIDPFTTRCNDGYSRTAPVGSYPRGISSYGVHDLAGNVREWVSDWYDEDYYEVSPLSNPQGPTSGTIKSARGGSWYTDRTWARATDRRPFAPDYRSNYIGFRCVFEPGVEQ
jgi:formylglycine-generating enzyme required for sulfatase activity